MHYDTSVNTQSLYIHWPFCPYKCNFCPFVALAGQDQFMQRYHTALTTELRQFARAGEKRHLETIFFGGGTPSTYPTPLLLDMFAILNNEFIIDNHTEISLEVNPGTVTNEQLKVWKEIGINRLSIGVQSLKDSVLQSLNRHQSAVDVTRLLANAAPLFNAISVDLILGLPGVSELEWKELINEVVNWPIAHISIYFLTVHENTPLYFKVQQKKVDIPDDDIIIPLYYWTLATLEKHGLYQYELSNFARPGFECKHNTVYWERKPYKGIGLGACSFDGSVRTQNEKSLLKYMTALEQGLQLAQTVENLTIDQVRLERLMLGLRRKVGVSIDELSTGFSSDQTKRWHEKIEYLISHQFLRIEEGRLMLTAQGLLLENEVVVQLARE